MKMTLNQSFIINKLSIDMTAVFDTKGRIIPVRWGQPLGDAVKETMTNLTLLTECGM